MVEQLARTHVIQALRGNLEVISRLFNSNVNLDMIQTAELCKRLIKASDEMAKAIRAIEEIN